MALRRKRTARIFRAIRSGALMMEQLMKILRVAFLALLSASLCHDSLAQEYREIEFGTTGEFGLDTNWSDPANAPPENPPGAPYAQWGNTNYFINDSQTATINAGSEHGSHFQVQNLFIGDSPTGLAPSPGTLIMNGGPAPAPGEFGVSLEALKIHELRLGKICNLGGLGPCTGGGTIIMNGSADLLANALIVGERARGEVYIGPDARVRSAEVIGEAIARRDIRIGTYGPERGLGVNTIDGDGFVQVEGELLGNTLYMPESDADGVLRVMPGGVVNLRGVDMTFEAFRPNRSSLLEIIGSGGSFTTTVGTFLASHPTATVKFTADAGGVTPIVSVGISGPQPMPPGGADVENGNLVLDLDDFNFTPSSTMLLIDVAPDALFGPFGTVTFLGNTTADVNYDYANGDIFLSNFFSTDPPGSEGDFNSDGKVDAADYVMWRKTGQPLNGHGLWRNNFGETNGSGSGGLAAAPEPASLTATLLLMVCCTGARASRRNWNGG
jgi:hypothetical protein